MEIDESFAQAVRKNPHDIQSRLVLADYFEDSGNPLADFIRVQVELENEEHSDEERLRLKKQERELIEKHSQAWLESIRSLGAIGVSRRCFNRGLIERIDVGAQNFLENGAELIKASPACHILGLKRLDNCSDFASIEIPEQIKTLDLSVCKLGKGKWIRNLANLPTQWFQNVTGLILRFNDLTEKRFEQLLTRVPDDQLTLFDAGVNSLSRESGSVFAHSQKFSRLETLVLSSNDLVADGASRMAKGSQLKNLKHLNLASTGIGNEGAKQILKSSAFPNLQELNLRGCGISSVIVDEFQRSKLVEQLKILDTRSNSSEIIKFSRL